jgi:branched-chain amino acid transport system substrate-binding protein
MSDADLVVAAAVSLSAGNARQGRMAAAGLAQAVDDVARAGGLAVGSARLTPRLALADDGGTAEALRRALDALTGADLVVGPYGSGLTGEAARWAAEHGRVLWNHGGSADEVEARPGVVSVASPTSRYLAAVLDVVAGRLPAARVLIGAGSGSFGRAAAAGAAEAAGRLGLDLVGVVPPAGVPTDVDADADVLLLAGSFDDDVAAVRRLRRRPPVVGAVAAGLSEWVDAVGVRRAEGVLAPSQWEEGVRVRADVGPAPVEVVRSLRSRMAPGLAPGRGLFHVEYPAAQAYAAVLVALRCVEHAGGVDDERLLAAARNLRCTTFFGRFGLGPDGRQSDHQIVVVQWQGGAKRIVGPPAMAEQEVVL